MTQIHHELESPGWAVEIADKISRDGKRWIVPVAALMACIYLVQVFSPLRINTDAVTLLNLAAKITDGKPYLVNGVRPVFPIGTPFVFSAMERFGVATPIGFGMVNLAFLAVAGLSVWIICKLHRLSNLSAAIVLFTLFSSFVLLKHSVLPLTDIPYMGISLACVAVLEASREQAGIRWTAAVAAAVILFAGSVLTRRVGIALIPAVLYALCPENFIGFAFSGQKPAVRRGGLVLRGLFLAMIAGVFIFASRLFYAPDFHLPDFRQQIQMRLEDFGELFLNAPAGQLGRLHFMVYPAGAVLMGLLVLGFFRRRLALRASHVYLLAYLGIMLFWPYKDARFWIPVLPLLSIVVLQALAAPAGRISITFGAVYLTLYGFMFFAAAMYSTRITFAGSQFPQVYGGGSFRGAYVAAWSGSGAEDEVAGLIQRYGASPSHRLSLFELHSALVGSPAEANLADGLSRRETTLAVSRRGVW